MNAGVKKYLLLGKMVEQRHPEIANELFTEISNSEPIETDMGKMSDYYNRFCRINDDYGKAETRMTDIMYNRRIFVAAMLHIYSPGTFHQPPEYCIVTKGFVSRLACVLGVLQPWGSKLYKEVIIMEKVYDDFRYKVEQTISQLTEN